MNWKDRVRRVTNSLRMAWKRGLSYRKKMWEFGDYPISVREQKDVPESSRYWARILGWNVDATSATQAAALHDLEKRFEDLRARLTAEGKPLPRPGTNVPIQFASQDRILANDFLANDFIERILNLDWAFLTDKSSLWDFHTESSNEEYFAKIKDAYFVDVSDIESGNIADILERITAARTAH